MSDEYVMSMDQLHEIFARGMGEGEVILDVRTDDEYAEGHIPGSINISHEQVPSRASELRGYRKIYMHCRSGRRVQMIRPILEEMGFSNIFYVEDGGMPDWEAARYPVE